MRYGELIKIKGFEISFLWEVKKMITIIFRCSETKKEYEEEFEFDDNVTDEEIEEEFKEWVWNEIGDYYTWYKKE